ncbi:MAG: acyl-CoA thioesterase II [Desulfobacteraceae bacterium]
MSVCVDGNVLKELLSLLQLEKIEDTIFRGQSQDLGFSNVFGGQVLGQALSAASHTVPSARTAHSMHAYFLRAGDASKPIVYTVDCIRDGKSFTTRRVVAIQNGKAIFTMAASFQVAETGFDHQDQMPQVPEPEGLESDFERAHRLAHKMPASIRERLLCQRPIETRTVNPIDPFEPEKKEPVQYVWLRAIGKMPDDPAVNKYVLAYASDFGMVITSLFPHGHTYWEPRIQAASLDHAMWFHRDFRMDQWLLHIIKSPNANKAKGLSRGKIYTRNGILVASTAQEGLIRFHK